MKKERITLTNKLILLDYFLNQCCWPLMASEAMTELYASVVVINILYRETAHLLGRHFMAHVWYVYKFSLSRCKVR